MVLHARMSSKRCGWVAGLLMIAVGFTASCTSGGPAASPSARTGGDPAIYAAAIDEIQSYLTMEVQDGPYAAAAVYLAPDEQPRAGTATTWPVP